MLKLTWIEFFIIGLPESFVLIWTVCEIFKQNISRSKFLISSILLALITYLVRFLPIHMGINTVISSVFMVCELIIIGVPLIKSIYGVVISTFMLMVGELCDLVLLNILRINVDNAFKNSFMKCILEFPSILFLILLTLMIRSLMTKREGAKGVSN
ncbi:MAG: hypothetical protein Q8930_11125 [Bacillota bacterium]|nr:hypothetical protein [Bacillota bacterium]